jgi:SSS family solute:Na+ symporter
MVQRVLAAKNEKIGQKIYKGTSMFFVCRFILPGLWGVAALAVLAPELVGDNTLLAMPKFLAEFLPIGLIGLLIAAMLAADMSTDAAYMLTWGSVIYNDILAPVHKGQWSQKKGLIVNRMIVGCIGIFLLIYGLWYPLKGDLWTYLTVTGTIYLSSMSVCLIACCYWQRANNWGAAGAIIIGASMPVSYLIFEQLEVTETLFRDTIGPYIWGIATYIAAALAMVFGSLLKPSSPRTVGSTVT